MTQSGREVFSQMAPPEKRYQIIAESPVMKRIVQEGAQIARSEASVLITGESGTGKEVIAHAIHFESERRANRFIKVNCAAIPASLIESEFFGHEKGAFTGALSRRIGRFEQAHLGTLLLDEVTEIPLALQAKLLRVIQEKEFERVGGNETIHVDVRLIATSNRDLRDAIEEKLFREDLYYRLNVVPIRLPPLRERKEDILPLTDYFLERLGKGKTLSASARKKLTHYPWPGNIRELTNLIERTVVICPSTIIDENDLIFDRGFSLEDEVGRACPITSFKDLTLSELEKRHILETLSLCSHNKTKTAAKLGITVRTLRNKLDKIERGES
jgi:two-component system response regulator AtoC